MKKLFTLFLGISLSISFGQILYQQTFENNQVGTSSGAGTYTFAPGFLLRNVDNLSPDPAVSYVNEAWERREDFSFATTDSAAFSTSWYLPTGIANDWMWTPVIGPLTSASVLSWNAVTYDLSFLDGYEVRVMLAPTTPTGGTGVIGNQITNSTVIFSIAAENNTWTSRTVSLAAYAGQLVYIGYRNNSNDKFLLLIDDIKVENLITEDARMVSLDTVSEYTQTPSSQLQPLTISGTVQNNGTNPLTAVKLNTRVYDAANVLVASATGTPITSLSPLSTANLVAGSVTIPSIPQTYTIKTFVDYTGPVDLNHGNDTITTTYVVTDSVYARDNGVPSGALGIGAGNGYLGQDFEIVTNTRANSVTFRLNRDNGKSTAVNIWNMSAGAPNVIVANSDTVTFTAGGDTTVTLPIIYGNNNLLPGRYAVTLSEIDSNLSLVQTTGLFTINRTWVDWPANPISGWGNNEDYGTGFMKSYYLRANLIAPCVAMLDSITPTHTSCGLANGEADLSTLLSGAYTYNWSTGATSEDITGLAAGTYTCIMSDATGCRDTAVVVINSSTPIVNSISSSTNETCAGCNDGSATVNVTGASGSITYFWTPSGGTSATASSLAPGTYTCTATDGNGCTDTAVVVINSFVGIESLYDENGISIYPNPNNGEFNLDLKLNYEGNATIEISDIHGKVVENRSITMKNGFAVNNKYHFSGLSSGNYMLKISTKDRTYLKKVVVK